MRALPWLVFALCLFLLADIIDRQVQTEFRLRKLERDENVIIGPWPQSCVEKEVSDV